MEFYDNSRHGETSIGIIGLRSLLNSPVALIVKQCNQDEP